MKATRIVGLGQSFAGDDAVGLAVTADLRARRLAGIELYDARDATELIALVADGIGLVLVDGMVGAPAGEVRQIALEELAPASPFRASGHALGVWEALALARELSPDVDPRRYVKLIGIGIATAARGQSQLSAAVRMAVPAAAALAVALARDLARRGE